MSEYTKKSTTPLKSLYYKRTKYTGKSIADRFVEPEGSGSAHFNLINYRMGELNLFGKVNQFFVPMTVRAAALAPFKSEVLADPAIPLKAVDFVAKVFEQMAQQFKKCAMSGKIHKDERFLSNLKVYRAYDDPVVLYNQYFASLSYTLKTEIKKRGITILTLDDLMNTLMNVLPGASLQVPFTQTGYIKSKHCSSTVSGLVIEIADLDYNNDQDKIDFFYNSLNWDFYVQTCNSYGFIVDASAPWRLIADIDSKIMKYQANVFGHSASPTMFLAEAFRSVPIQYMDRFERDLYNLFQTLRTPQQVSAEICEVNGELQPVITYSPNYTFVEFNSQKSGTYYIEKYFQIRFLEEESSFTAAEQQRLINDSLGLFETGRYGDAIKQFERILNKPFDYLGSVSYNIKYGHAREMYVLANAPDEAEIQREISRIKQRKNLK